MCMCAIPGLSACVFDVWRCTMSRNTKKEEKSKKWSLYKDLSILFHLIMEEIDFFHKESSWWSRFNKNDNFEPWHTIISRIKFFSCKIFRMLGDEIGLQFVNIIASYNTYLWKQGFFLVETSWGWAGPSSAKAGDKLGVASSKNSARIN